jgi:hypothetical protein
MSKTLIVAAAEDDAVALSGAVGRLLGEGVQVVEAGIEQQVGDLFDDLNIARRLWDQREELRGEYEDVHGTDRARWPVQHLFVVLDAVPSAARGACLGCEWFDVRGHWMGHSDWFKRASVWPHRHEVSNGVFLDDPRRWRGGRFDPP